VKTVEITVVFQVELPDDADASHMGIDVRNTDVFDRLGDKLGQPHSYATTNVEVIEKP
jgi:hypothetical protein